MGLENSVSCHELRFHGGIMIGAGSIPRCLELGRRTETLKFLIHDRDPIFTRAFNEVFEAEYLKITRAAAHAPRMNAYCERVIGTLRREHRTHIFSASQRPAALCNRPPHAR
jgi:hypothetical protein